MAEYVKLGNKASGGQFYDPKTGLQVSGDEIVELTPTHKDSEKVRNALAGGHIVMASAFDYMNKNKVAKKGAEQAKPDKAELARIEAEKKAQEAELEKQLKYLKENYEVTEEYENAFKAMTSEERELCLEELKEDTDSKGKNKK